MKVKELLEQLTVLVQEDYDVANYDIDVAISDIKFKSIEYIMNQPEDRVVTLSLLS